MKKLQCLKVALVGGASMVALTHPAAAKLFNIPSGDLSTALSAYMQQSGVDIVYVGDTVRGHHSAGAKGDYTETAALSQILSGTGFTTKSMSSDAIGIVPAPGAAPSVRIAQASRAAAPQQVGLETVVVTAQKKSENIQTVPIAITALSQQQLTERQIAGGPDLVKEVPNLTFSKTNFTGYNLEIRGVGTQAISVTTDPAVAVAFNDTPFIRNHFFEQEFYDVDNLEVLRGPQGTLYGRNATGGVVNLVSAKPTDAYEAMLSADIGNYGNRRFEGMLNLPIVGDTLDIRIAGEWTKRDGYDTDTELNSSIDGRDLWSGRITIGWKPRSDIQSYLVWEHFSESDDRLRSGKQLCKTAPIPNSVEGVPVLQLGSYDAIGDYLSQGCEDTSLYSRNAFEIPNGYSLTYYAALESADGALSNGFDVYSQSTQSTNLRNVESAVLPRYTAKNDTLEYNVDWNVGGSLTFTSQSGYNNDFLWSTEDYNRFDSAPGAFLYPGSTFNPTGQLTSPDPAAGTGGVPTNGGIFCDPQLGCSDRLVLQDLSTERSWQASQEFRLVSNFDGPLNFSFGGNFLHYETDEDYYVFVNSITSFEAYQGTTGDDVSGVVKGNSTWIPGVTNNSQCLTGGYRYRIPSNAGVSVLSCDYIDPHSLASVDGEGHNYFLSQNPYVLNSYAAFGEIYYKLANDLKLTGGLRFTDDQKHFDIIPSELLIPGYGYPETGTVDQQWDQFTGRMVADWTPKLDFTDQTLIYASYAHGYKAGGANPPGAFYPLIDAGGGSGVANMPAHPLTFKPEFIEAFELGTKNTLLDGALTLNGDIFYYNYQNYQISEIVDRTAINNNYNSHMEGVELETNWEPLPGLKFSLAQGFENTGLAGGDSGIDLMDRTAGMPGWMVVKPYPTTSSNCILPTYVVAAAVAQNNFGLTLCSDAYERHLDPVTGLPYQANPNVYVGPSPVFPAGYTGPNPYPGFDPLTAPNDGEGFSKSLAGNQLPNAPHFTTSLTAEYTIPVSEDWVATLHTDFYWQSQQWARVFEDPIDKIHGYSNVNLSLILASANGWQIMGYVKNVFNVTAITGTFLNSDDSGLTTNVFLTDPRLVGVRVTKHLDQNDGFWGSDYSGYDFFTGLFSDTDNGAPPIWIELGGQFASLSNPQQHVALPFTSDYNGGQSPLQIEHQAHYGIDEDATVSFRPDDSAWVFSGSIQIGRAKFDKHQHLQTANKNIPVTPFTAYGVFNLGGYSFYPSHHVRFADTVASQGESHAIVDFLAGKDVGLGMFGMEGSSVLSAGVRVAQFISKSNVELHAEPDLQYPTATITNLAGLAQFVSGPDNIRFHDYAEIIGDKASFHGLGPELAWNASTPVSGDEREGEITFDWGANVAVLYGRQRAKGHHQTSINSYYLTNAGNFDGLLQGPANKGQTQRGFFSNHAVGANGFNGVYPTAHRTQHASHSRSRMVAVPNLGGFAGISVKYHNAKVSFGYRADEFFGAMDGGIDSYKAENRGFFGPYANISIGLGG